MQRQSTVSSIPALRAAGGAWLLDAKSKADLLGRTFSSKCKLVPAETNSYSGMEATFCRPQRDIRTIGNQDAERELSELKEGSATGPDSLSRHEFSNTALQS